MSNNLQVIKETTIEETTKIIESEAAITFAQLKSISQEFLSKVLEIYNNGSLKRIHSNGVEEIMRLWTIYRDRQTSQALALAQNQFEVALNSFLDRKIILTHVNKEGKMILYTEKGVIEILSAVSKNAGRANFTIKAFGTAEQINKLPAELKPGKEKDLIEYIQKSTLKRNQVYTVGQKRYDAVQKGKTESGSPLNAKVKRMYYYKWENNPVVLGFPDSGFSRGEMAEAYANIIINNDSKVRNGDIENSLEYMYDNYIKSKKDNIAAVVQGDIKVGKSGQIFLAVKGQSASTAKIGQYIAVAHYITTQLNLTKGSLENWIKNSFKGIDKYAQEVEEEAGGMVFEEVLQQAQKSLT